MASCEVNAVPIVSSSSSSSTLETRAAGTASGTSSELQPSERRGTLTVNGGSASPRDEVEFEEGKVDEVKRIMLLYGDQGLAHRMQDGEYALKYEWNRQERRTARTDVPLAIETQGEADRQREIEELHRLERLKQIIDEDERLAKQLLENEGRGAGPNKNMGVAGTSPSCDSETSGISLESDAELARRLQNDDLLQIEREKIRREIIDEDFARRLQLAIEAEERDDAPTFCRPLNHSVEDTSPLSDSGDEGLGVSQRLGGTTFVVGRFGGFYVPRGRSEDLTEEERRLLLRMQDEELAKALQEQENMRSLNLHAERDTASRDAQLAYVMQQLEQFRAEQHRTATIADYPGGGVMAGARRPLVIQPPAYRQVVRTESPSPPYTGRAQDSNPAPPYQRSESLPITPRSQIHPTPNQPGQNTDNSRREILSQNTERVRDSNLTSITRSNRNVGNEPVVGMTNAAGNVPTVGGATVTASNENISPVPVSHENENFVNELGEQTMRQNSEGGSTHSGQNRPLPEPPVPAETGPRAPIRSRSVGATTAASNSALVEESRRQHGKSSRKRITSCKTQ